MMTSKEDIKKRYEDLVENHKLMMLDINELSEDQVNFHSDENSWNMIQVLDHVKNAESGTLGYINKKLKYGGLKKLDWSAGLRAQIMKAVNNSSIRFKMPAALPQPTSDLSLEEIQKDWEKIRSQWRSGIDSFPEEHLDKAIFKHPIFGRMSLMHAVESMIAHQNHHLKQINRIRKTLNKTEG